MNPTPLKRRAFLGQSGLQLGALAATSLLGRSARADTGLANLPHFPAKAKRVIYLFQSGGPSHIDLFDHSPAFEKLHGTPLPDSVRGGQRLTGMTAGQKEFLVSGPIAPMRQRGECGTWMSDLVPHTAAIADKITVINSMHTEAINHDPGITLINTGSQIPGPSAGAWASYGLGSANANMPAYVVLLSQGNGKNPGQPIFSRLWGSGFLPSQHQGVLMRSSGAPLLYLDDPPGLDRATRREMLDDLAALNRGSYAKFFDPEIETRIAQYEMAFRMQTAAPEIVDLSGEPESTFRLYGDDARLPGTYAYNCLLARRLAERDVRFIQLFHRGWGSTSGNLKTQLGAQCKDTDRASAALVTDLEQRGLLDETLVIWGGEFGRTSYAQGGLGNGRDHHGRCFSIWMAGGGIKRGHVHGATDDYCYNITSDPVYISDMNATLLHCLGIDHERFTFKFQGLNARLTGVEDAKVVRGVLAQGAGKLTV